MNKVTATLGALFCAAGLGQMAQAQTAGFDPNGNCTTLLGSASEADRVMIAAWTFGFIAASSDAVRPVDANNNAVLIGNLARVCQANPDASLLALVEASSRPAATTTTPAPQAAAPGSEAEVRALLMEFLQPGADLRALTQAILPTEDEVKAVYGEPLASALWASYKEQMGPGTAFGPKADHNDILVVYTTTRALFEQKPVLDEFPGGYKDVLQYFKIDVPIVRFKFIEAGETLGLAFDGLMYLNGRWVIMPKPWRSLPN
ncbi:MAG: hypothetical protein WA790_01875 [Sulfitobacter sp.]